MLVRGEGSAQRLHSSSFLGLPEKDSKYEPQKGTTMEPLGGSGNRPQAMRCSPRKLVATLPPLNSSKSEMQCLNPKRF